MDFSLAFTKCSQSFTLDSDEGIVYGDLVTIT